MFKLVVLSSVLALARSSAVAHLGWGGLGWAGHLAGPVAAPLAAPLVAHAAPAVAVGPVSAVALGAPGLGHAYNYRGPLSLAPGQPANILAADGRPLDTLSVNLDRAVHYTARAVNNGHHLWKRSAPLLAAPAVAWSHTARLDLPAAVPALAAPLAWRAPVAPVAPWSLGHLGVGHLGVGHLGVAHAGLYGHLG